jgi:hypothetical protein
MARFHRFAVTGFYRFFARERSATGVLANTISRRITNSDAEILGQAAKPRIWDSDGANPVIGKPLPGDFQCFYEV